MTTDRYPNGRPGHDSGRAAAWVSRGFAELVHDLANDAGRAVFRERHGVDFDVLIVGSGYGGAIAAAELAGRADDTGRVLRVGVLERGEEYLPGAFPNRMTDLAGHVRFSVAGSTTPRGTRTGLFDFRAGSDIATVVANGLGGGSLINAGVMLEPTDAVLGRASWPASLRADSSLRDWFSRARRMLGAGRGAPDTGAAERPNTILDHPDGAPPKYRALQRLAHQAPDARFGPTPITVAMRPCSSSGGVALNGCVRCGDCATGCNFGAKDSLDVNLLARAARDGAELYTGATALRVERNDVGAGWRLIVNHTDDKLRMRQRPVAVRARRLVIAAGTLGSAELLLRSRCDGFGLSPALGAGFSGNGDMIAAVYRRTHPTNSVADETTAPALRDIGPTITGVVDLREGGEEPIVIEELAIPGPLRRLLEESLATTDALTRLARFDGSRHRADDDGRDPAAIDPDAVDRTTIVAMMGDDGAGGCIVPVAGALLDDDGDGAVEVRWPGLAQHPLFPRQIAALERLVPASESRALVFPNQMWQPIPRNVASVIGSAPGPLLTVHPLGGCRMADDPANGVVDAIGRVYLRDRGSGARAGESPLGACDDLVVLDGSIVPTSLGVNPALTIAALALRSVCRLRDDVWRLRPAAGATGALATLTRPSFAPIDPRQAPPRPVDTELEVVERLVGRVDLDIAGNAHPFVVELTLRFLPAGLRSLMSRLDRCLELRTRGHADFPEGALLDEGTSTFGSRIRVYPLDTWHDLFGDPDTREELALPAGDGPALQRLRRREALQRDRERCLDARAAFSAPLSGNLRFLHREDSSAIGRILAALPAWAFNRGLRDIFQYAEEQFFPPAGGGDHGHDSGLLDWIRQIPALLSRAGEVRLFDYELHIGAPERDADPRLAGLLAGDRRIRGAKRLSYVLGGNPWQQLQTVVLDRFPLLEPHIRHRELFLDAAWLARIGTPLVRVTQQNSQPEAIVDMGAFLAYLARLLANLHVWTFRKPDAARDESFERGRRLPCALPGISGFETIDVETGETWGADAAPVRVRLSRYRLAASDPRARGGLRSAALADPGGAARNPVVLLHGYSASGSTYAHPAIRPNLVQRLCARGRDVWVLDFRTSAGLPTAIGDWSFEDVALRDIPLALERIRAVRRMEGSADLPIDVVAHCMGAVMFSMAIMRPDGHDGPCRAQLDALPGWLGRVVLSQAGPALEFSPANVFRAYAMNYLRHFVGLRDYRFRPDDLESGSGGTEPTPVAAMAAGLLDRGLSSMPYPAGEFFVENPLLPWRRAPFCRARHRIDALYGRSFSVRNMPARVLAHIDELFGPLSIETVAQTIAMARQQRIADGTGRAYDLAPEALARRWTFQTLHLHAADNGLLDPTTQFLMQSLFAHPSLDTASRPTIRFVRLPGIGHQDAMIGRRAGRVFDEIEAFLA